MQGIHGTLKKDFGSEFTRMMSSAKLTPVQAERIWSVPVDHIIAVMEGKEAPSVALEEALEAHTPLYVGDVYTKEARENIPLYDDTTDGITVLHAADSDRTKRPLFRTEREGVCYQVYDYADTAVSRVSNSMIIPERIWQNIIVEDGSAERIPGWASNQGHFEQQMTMHIGKVTTSYTDREGNVCPELMETYDMEWHVPYIPHLFTKRDEREGMILAVTYRGEVGTREFLDEIAAMSDEAYLKKIVLTLEEIDASILTTKGNGYFVGKFSNAKEEVEGSYMIKTILSDVPFQPHTLGCMYLFSHEAASGPDTTVSAERWGYVLGETPVKLVWAGHEEILEPNSSFFIKQDVPHALCSTGGEAKVMIMQVCPGEEDPWKTLALTYHCVGEEGVKRARKESKQWTK